MPLLTIGDTLFSLWHQRRRTGTTVNTEMLSHHCMQTFIPLATSVFWGLNAVSLKDLFCPNPQSSPKFKPPPCSNKGHCSNPAPPSGQQSEYIYNQCSVKTAQDHLHPSVRPQFRGWELNSWQMFWMILGTNL